MDQWTCNPSVPNLGNNTVYHLIFTSTLFLHKLANLRIPWKLCAGKFLVLVLYFKNLFYQVDSQKLSARKGSDWIGLVFAHPFPLNNGAPVASTNFISDGKVQVYTLMMELAQLMGAPLFKTNGWAQSSPYPVSPFLIL